MHLLIAQLDFFKSAIFLTLLFRAVKPIHLSELLALMLDLLDSSLLFLD